MVEQRPAEAGSSGAPALGKEPGMGKKELEPCLRVLGWEMMRKNKRVAERCEGWSGRR